VNNTTYSGITISGVGHHLPEHAEDNSTLCLGLDVTPKWILEKTGIEKRYVADSDDSASDYATKAGQRALEMAAVVPDQIDLIVVTIFSRRFLPKFSSN
jgi:3-oxoacyl-[acyl-carrier-protein] synthase-3